MESFEEISKMNLADLGPDSEDDRADETITEDESVEEVVVDAVEEDTEESTDIPQKKEVIDEPVGEYYKIDANITEGELRSFLLGHTYHSVVGIVTVIAGIALPIYSLINGGKGMLYSLIIAAVFLVYYPFTNVLKAKKVMKSNKTFSETFHYMMDEVGLHLQLSEEAIDVEWRYFIKMMELKNIVVVYTTRVNGYIIPKKDMGDQKEEILAFLRSKIKKK